MGFRKLSNGVMRILTDQSHKPMIIKEIATSPAPRNDPEVSFSKVSLDLSLIFPTPPAG